MKPDYRDAEHFKEVLKRLQTQDFELLCSWIDKGLLKKGIRGFRVEDYLREMLLTHNEINRISLRFHVPGLGLMMKLGQSGSKEGFAPTGMELILLMQQARTQGLVAVTIAELWAQFVQGKLSMNGDCLFTREND